MPSWYDQPSVFANGNVEDINRFQKLPFYLVANELKAFPTWNVFDQLYGTIPWKPNMGTTMRATTPQPSPVGSTFVFPNNIDTQSNKNVHKVGESYEEARVKHHDFESEQFSFVPSFQDFWTGHLAFQNKDLANKIQLFNNQFIRTNLWSKSNYVYIAGTGLVSGAPQGDINTAGTAAGSKTTAWLLAQIPNIKDNFSLRAMNNATIVAREDLGMPPFDGVKNMPKDNEGIKGMNVFVGSSEAWSALRYDPDVNNLKSIDLDLLFNDFRGSLFGQVTYKIERYPMRFDATGTFIAPEVYDVATQKSLPNPVYTNLGTAPYEVAWLLGQDACKTIKIGPPPKEFASQNISNKKFYSLRWNGEIQLTDQILITNSDGSLSLNRYGTQLQFISKGTFGYLTGEPRFAFPILFKRKRPALLP